MKRTKQRKSRLPRFRWRSPSLLFLLPWSPFSGIAVTPKPSSCNRGRPTSGIFTRPRRFAWTISPSRSICFRCSPSPAHAGAIAKLQEYKAHIQKWKSDLAEEQQKAQEYEHEVHLAERRAGHYDLGEALLQIAVVLSSITLFTRRRSYFVFGLSLGVLGILVAAMAVFVR